MATLWTRLVFAALPILLAGSAAAFDKGGVPHNGKGQQKQDDGNDGQLRAQTTRYFRPGDAQLILRSVGPQSLPPGLQKKLARTGSLPPGWEKRFHPLPPNVVQQLPPVCSTCRLGIADNYAVVYDQKTRMILDTIQLINDMRR